MASTSGTVFEKAACKFCGDEIAINSMTRHEIKCQNKTPEQRHQAKVARQYASTVTRRPTEASKPAGLGGSGKWVHKYTECEHCHDRIDVAFMTRHQKMCAAQTPEEREHEKQKRQRQRDSYAQNEGRRKEANRRATGNPHRRPIKHPVLPALGTDLDEPVVRPYHKRQQPDDMQALTAATRHAEMTLESNGRPVKTMKITMTLNEDQVALTVGRAVLHKLPEVLALVLPGFVVNDFKVR
jgi:hypothetical protein